VHIDKECKKWQCGDNHKATIGSSLHCCVMMSQSRALRSMGMHAIVGAAVTLSVVLVKGSWESAGKILGLGWQEGFGNACTHAHRWSSGC